MFNLILVGLMSFISGALLMHCIDMYYYKQVLFFFRNNPESLNDPEIREKIEEILR